MTTATGSSSSSSQVTLAVAALSKNSIGTSGGNDAAVTAEVNRLIQVGEWRQHEDKKTGRPYFSNSKTKAVVWDLHKHIAAAVFGIRPLHQQPAVATHPSHTMTTNVVVAPSASSGPTAASSADGLVPPAQNGSFALASSTTAARPQQPSSSSATLLPPQHHASSGSHAIIAAVPVDTSRSAAAASSFESAGGRSTITAPDIMTTTSKPSAASSLPLTPRLVHSSSLIEGGHDGASTGTAAATTSVATSSSVRRGGATPPSGKQSGAAMASDVRSVCPVVGPRLFDALLSPRSEYLHELFAQPRKRRGLLSPSRRDGGSLAVSPGSQDEVNGAPGPLWETLDRNVAILLGGMQAMASSGDDDDDNTGDAEGESGRQGLSSSSSGATHQPLLMPAPSSRSSRMGIHRQRYVCYMAMCHVAPQLGVVELDRQRVALYLRRPPPSTAAASNGRPLAATSSSQPVASLPSRKPPPSSSDTLRNLQCVFAADTTSDSTLPLCDLYAAAMADPESSFSSVASFVHTDVGLMREAGAGLSSVWISVHRDSHICTVHQRGGVPVAAFRILSLGSHIPTCLPFLPLIRGYPPPPALASAPVPRPQSAVDESHERDVPVAVGVFMFVNSDDTSSSNDATAVIDRARKRQQQGSRSGPLVQDLLRDYLATGMLRVLESRISFAAEHLPPPPLGSARSQLGTQQQQLEDERREAVWTGDDELSGDPRRGGQRKDLGAVQEEEEEGEMARGGRTGGLTHQPHAEGPTRLFNAPGVRTTGPPRTTLRRGATSVPSPSLQLWQRRALSDNEVALQAVYRKVLKSVAKTATRPDYGGTPSRTVLSRVANDRRTTAAPTAGGYVTANFSRGASPMSGRRRGVPPPPPAYDVTAPHDGRHAPVDRAEVLRSLLQAAVQVGGSPPNSGGGYLAARGHPSSPPFSVQNEARHDMALRMQQGYNVDEDSRRNSTIAFRPRNIADGRAASWAHPHPNDELSCSSASHPALPAPRRRLGEIRDDDIANMDWTAEDGADEAAAAEEVLRNRALIDALRRANAELDAEF